MILPADMPELGSEDLSALIAAFQSHPDRLIQATAQDGTPGHPVIFPPDCLPEFARLSGDTGARAVLKAPKSRLCRLAQPQRRACTDLDSPEDWARWRAENQTT